MNSTKTVTANFTYKGASHSADVLISNAYWEKGSVIYDDTLVEVQKIDNKKCLDIFMQGADDYFAMCKLAKQAAVNS